MGGALADPTTWSQWPELSDVMGLLNLEQVLAVLVFGSVARGDPDERSDLDVLVVVEDRPAQATLRHRLRNDANLASTPLVLTSRGLLTELADRPSFVSHLLDEGVTLFEGPAWSSLRAQLVQAVSDPEALAREIKSRARDLVPLSKPDRFPNSPVTVLSHLFGVSRSLVIARLLQAGIHEYGWRRAFDRYAEVRPELRPDLEALKGLRPYYEYARARNGATLPDQVLSVDDVRSLVRSAGQLAR